MTVVHDLLVDIALVRAVQGLSLCPTQAQPENIEWIKM